MAGAASREGLSCGLRECGARGWGGAGRRGGAGAGTVGEDGLHGEGILHGGDDAPVGPELDAVLGERGAEEVAAELFEAGAIGGGDPDGR